jgi:hypothetical protein
MGGQQLLGVISLRLMDDRPCFTAFHQFGGPEDGDPVGQAGG